MSHSINQSCRAEALNQCIPGFQHDFGSMHSIYLKQIAIFRCMVTKFCPNPSNHLGLQLDKRSQPASGLLGLQHNQLCISKALQVDSTTEAGAYRHNLFPHIGETNRNQGVNHDVATSNNVPESTTQCLPSKLTSILLHLLLCCPAAAAKCSRNPAS